MYRPARALTFVATRRYSAASSSVEKMPMTMRSQKRDMRLSCGKMRLAIRPGR